MSFLVAAARALSHCCLLDTATPLLGVRPWQPEHCIPLNSSTEEDAAQRGHGLVTHGFMQKKSCAPVAIVLVATSYLIL